MTDEAPRQEHYREVVRLIDVADDALVMGHSFVECHILGPSVVAPFDNLDFLHCSFEGDRESLFWEVQPERFYMGAIGLRDVSFVKCRFEMIGIAGIANTLERFKAEIDSQLG